MSTEFMSIWIDLKENHGKTTTTCSFYREWSHLGKKLEKSQVQRIKIFTNQIEEAAKNRKNIIIIGDANLCANKGKWVCGNKTHNLESCDRKWKDRTIPINLHQRCN